MVKRPIYLEWQASITHLRKTYLFCIFPGQRDTMVPPQRPLHHINPNQHPDYMVFSTDLITHPFKLSWSVICLFSVTLPLKCQLYERRELAGPLIS